MTNEQAIIRLRRISNSLSKYCDVNDCIRGDCAKCYETLNMAIETLEQEQTTKDCSDVISRQDAIDAVIYDGITTLNADERKLLIEQIPSAELKRGRWVDDDNYLFYANCSECGYQMDTHEERGYHNYCPHCGVKMESEE